MRYHCRCFEEEMSMMKNFLKGVINRAGYEITNKRSKPEVEFEQDMNFLDLYNHA